MQVLLTVVTYYGYVKTRTFICCIIKPVHKFPNQGTLLTFHMSKDGRGEKFDCLPIINDYDQLLRFNIEYRLIDN